VIATFLVIFLSSWRASRLNITAAIRDLPESKPIDPEAETWRGYYRAVINGLVALALPIGLSFLLFGPGGMALGIPMVVIGLISPWFYVLRGANVAAPMDHRTAEGLPRWPWILGLVLPVIGWVLILPWYFIAVALVRFVRDRKPAGLPRWTRVLGLVVWPFAFVLVLLQQWRIRIAWTAAMAAAFGVAGVALTYGGLDRNSAFFFLLGVSLVFLWVAVTLHYFGVAERVSFTTTSAALLALWYVPSSWMEPITGELNGDIEMFFLSGMVMVTCGVFIIIYNADIVLPAIARLGSGFSRIVPALKTGVAYPLTSRFRTGMAMAMIGLIMFSLVMMATINRNFAALFLNEDSKGGFDIVVRVNENNRVDDIEAALAKAGTDTRRIAAVGELRMAFPFEAEVENRDEFVNAEDRQVKPYSRSKVFGADPGFLAANRVPMKFRAAGYATDRDIWDAIAKDPSLAVIPASTTAVQQGFGQGPNEILRLKPLDAGFEPFTLELRDPGTGNTRTVTVIGQIKEAGDTFLGIGTPDFSTGIIIQRRPCRSIPASRGQRFYLSLVPGTDAEAYAKSVEAGLVQASADSLQALLDEQQGSRPGFFWCSGVHGTRPDRRYRCAGGHRVAGRGGNGASRSACSAPSATSGAWSPSASCSNPGSSRSPASSWGCRSACRSPGCYSRAEISGKRHGTSTSRCPGSTWR